MTLSNEQVKELRKDFPIFNGQKLIYIDNAATTQKPKQVIQAVQEFYTAQNANIHRGIYNLSQEATQKYEQARNTIAAFIGAEPEELIFTRNATEAINLVAYTLHSLIGTRKEIVLSEMEHHANLVPWQQFAKRHGMQLKFIAMKPDYTLDYEDAARKITENTALLAITHISNALGTINDVRMFVQLAKEKGAFTLIDAAQSAAHVPINVKALECDFLALSGHKMCGPTGIGVLYGRKELLEKMEPFNVGGDMIHTVSYEDATWNKLPHKFEAGTPHIAGAIGLATAVVYLKKIGMHNVAAWDKDILKYALEKMKALKGITLYNAGGDKSAGIISFNVDGVHPHDIASLLNDEGVCVRAGHHCAMPLMSRLGVSGTLRASFYFYTTYEDVDAFITALKNAQEVLHG